MRADLRFDRAAILAIALARTRASKPPAGRWHKWLGDELRLAWSSARALRDARRAEMEVAALCPVERAARQLELSAALAGSAIPSRPDEAAALRRQIDRLRHAADQGGAEHRPVLPLARAG